MSSSLVNIWNMALIRLGSTKLIGSPTEDSNERKLCSAVYEQCRDFVLRDFPWRFAKRRVSLAMKAGTPPSAWAYQYSKPADCLRLRAIAVPGSRNPLIDSKIPFELACDGDGSEIIYTDLPEAELIYTTQVTDTTKFDATFVSALAFNIAAELAYGIKGKADLVQVMQQYYSRTVAQAAANSLNEGFETTPTCSLLEARNG